MVSKVRNVRLGVFSGGGCHHPNHMTALLAPERLRTIKIVITGPKPHNQVRSRSDLVASPSVTPSVTPSFVNNSFASANVM